MLITEESLDKDSSGEVIIRIRSGDEQGGARGRARW
jgi:hypothetical protein